MLFKEVKQDDAEYGMSFQLKYLKNRFDFQAQVLILHYLRTMQKHDSFITS